MIFKNVKMLKIANVLLLTENVVLKLGAACFIITINFIQLKILHKLR